MRDIIVVEIKDKSSVLDIPHEFQMFDNPKSIIKCERLMNLCHSIYKENKNPKEMFISFIDEEGYIICTLQYKRRMFFKTDVNFVNWEENDTKIRYVID